MRTRITIRLIIAFALMLVAPIVSAILMIYVAPNNPTMAKSIFFPLCMFMIFLSLLFSLWVYWGIFKPIKALTKATQEIRDGNLDYVMERDEISRDEIGELCDYFDEMRLRLKSSQEEKLRMDQENREMISNISHDLKTPITSIKGYAEGIMDGIATSPEVLDKYIRTIYNKANDMQTLIDELTFYSHIDTNRVPYTFVRLGVREYFDDCFEEIGLDLEAQNIAFKYENAVDYHVEIIADPEQLKRVVNNIIGNAVKYMDKPVKAIWFNVSDVGDFIQVDIKDNGRGVAVADLPKIFERFYRTDASRNSTAGGSGIGLSIVKKIIEDHGGHIWASSKEGEGLTMHFEIRKYREVLQVPEEEVIDE